MNDVLRVTKRLFTVGVVVATIAWSIGFAAFVMPLAAEAATLAAGDLIKGSLSAVYYYGADGKRYVFPNENTYFSWYPDFSTVKVITDAELADISIGGNTTIRPGTFLIKITSDPKVYAVTSGGNLHWVETEDIAVKLWGADWATWVVDVPDSFFTNYSIDSSISDYTHPAGCLIQYEGDSKVYLISNPEKRWIETEAAFNANMFQWRFLISPVAADVTYADGSSVTGAESGLTDLVAGAAGSGTGLSVALASDTPAGATLPIGSSSNKLLKINLTASADGEVILDSLAIHRFGVGAAADWSNLYLYEGNTRLTSGRSINSTTHVGEFNNLNKTIASSATLALTLVGDVAALAVAGDEHGFELVAATAVGTAATVNGTFPIKGNTFTIGAATGAAVTIMPGTNPANPIVGAVGADVATFRISATGADVELQQITLTQIGTISNSDLTGLELTGSGVIATAASLVGDKLVLELTSPYAITNGQTKTFTVSSTCGGRSGRTISFYLEYTTDLMIMDTTFGSGATITNNYTSAAASLVTLQGGQVSVAFNGPATGNVRKAADNAIFYQFAMTAADQNVEVRRIRIGLYGVGGSLIDTAGTDLFSDIKIIDEDTASTLMGPVAYAGADEADANNATFHTWTISNPFYINQAQTRNLAVSLDVANNAYFDTGAEQYFVRLFLFGTDYIKEVDTGDWVLPANIVPNATTDGNTMTVKASSLTVGLAGSPVSNVYVRRQTDVPAVGFTFTAGTQGDVVVNTIVVTGYASVGGAATSSAQTSNVVTKIKLWDEDAGAQVGVSRSPSTVTGAATFSSLGWTIPAGETYTLIPQVDFDSIASTSTPDMVEFGIALAADITAEDQDNNALTAVDTDGAGWTVPVNGVGTGFPGNIFQTVRNAGVLSITAHSNPDPTIIVSGDAKTGTWYEFAQAKMTAQYEAMTIDRIRVKNIGTAANGNFYRVGIKSGGTIVGQATLSSGASSTDVALTTPITVAKDGSVNYQIVGQLNANGGGAVSGAAPALATEFNIQTGDWDANYAGMYNVWASGAASGARVYTAAAADLAGNAMTVRRTKINLAKQSLTSSSLTNGEMEINKEKITADSAGDASLVKLTYNVSMTDAGTAMDLSNFRFYRGSIELSTGTVQIRDRFGTNLRTNSVTYSVTTTTVDVFVYWVSGTEQVISGSGNTYTLKATLAGVNSGDSISTSLRTGFTPVVYTSQLVSWPHAVTYLPNTVAAPDYFLWSDNSAIPHNAYWGAPCSIDWTNDYLLQSISESFVLSA